MKKYVIIGNGTAAAGCIEGIRSADAEGAITVVSEERRPVYCRPLISYFLEGKTTQEKMNYRPDDFYEKNGCEALYGRRAVRIDAEGKTVSLDDGSVLPYDALCVASGSSLFVPKFEGLETVKDRFSFMTMDDMFALDAAADEKSRVLIVGAGLIGLKCAEGLHGRVAEITVCDLAPRVLSSILDDSAAAPVEECLKRNDIRLMLSESVARFEENRAVMTGGGTVEFDLLVLAVGVRANSAIVRGAGGETGRGIVVDHRMSTSLPEVFAAGDCTESEDISCGKRKVMAILPNAYIQGHCAGVNMAGGDETFDKAVPMNSIGFFGLHIMSAGTCSAEDSEVFEEESDGGLKRFYVKDGRLAGFILVGGTERAGIYTSLIRERTPLSEVDFELLKKTATTAAFSPETRRKKFGGVV